MRINNIPVRYVGELRSPNYATHTREFVSLEHARETLRDLPHGCADDSILLVPVDVNDSAGEAHARLDDDCASGIILSRGPRGGIKSERF